MVRFAITMTVVLMLAGCAQYEPIVWLGADTDIERSKEDESLGGRIGLKAEQFEAGIAANWYSNDIQTYGVYLMHYPPALEILEVEMQTYIGGQCDFDLDTEGQLTRFFAGTLHPSGAYVEYRYDAIGGEMEPRMDDEHKVAAGWRFKIK